MGGMSHGGMGMGHGMGFSHAAFGHPGFGCFAGVHHFNRFDHRFAFRHHRFFRHRFAFVGAFPYAYDDCLTRVWTRWGWRWVSLCY